MVLAELLAKDKTLPNGLEAVVRLSEKRLTCWIKESPLKLKQKGINHGLLSLAKRKGRGGCFSKNRLAYGSFLKDRVKNGLIFAERYYPRLRDSKEPYKVRLQIVIHYFTHGFSKSFTAKAFSTTTKTVRKPVERYKKDGEEGLKDKSRRPHTSPKRTEAKLEELVLELRKKTNYGVR